MKPYHGAVALCAVLATAVSGVSGFVGTHNLLALVPSMLLLRYVFADFEGTLTAALVGTALMALVGLSRGDVNAVIVALGGFAAAEIASVGTTVRRRQSIVGFGILASEAAVNVGVAAAAVVGTAAIALLHPPTWVALVALVVLAVVVLAAALRSYLRRSTPG